MIITMTHGSGGKATGDLISSIFAKHFSNRILDLWEDSAVVDITGRIAMTTDSYVVTPLFFKGGDIGKLCVCGTVNDLLMAGSIPKYLTIGFIIEEGADSETLERIAVSASMAAKEAGILIVAGDTKVIEGNGGIYINTSGVGSVIEGHELGLRFCSPGDAIIISGEIGNHHAAIISNRLGINNEISSDCAPLVEPVNALFKANVRVKAMRDVTRGGLATVLNEAALSCGNDIEIEEKKIPVSSETAALCGLLGLDPLYMANEGKFIAIVDPEDADLAVNTLKQTKYGSNAEFIGVIKPLRQSVCSNDSSAQPAVHMITEIGGRRRIDVMYGEGLPRIC